MSTPMLVRCTDCGEHVRRDDRCPHCHAVTARPRSLGRRGGLLAASLLGLSLAVGCASSPAEPEAPLTDEAPLEEAEPETPPADGDEVVDGEEGEDEGEEEETDEDARETVPVPQPPVALYGVPPMEAPEPPR